MFEFIMFSVVEGEQYARDIHFINDPGINLDNDEDKKVIKKMLLNKASIQHLLNTYFCLTNHQVKCHVDLLNMAFSLNKDQVEYSCG